MLLAAVALLGALHLPQRWFQSRSEALLGAFQARAEERGGQAPAPEDAVADLGILASACGWNCGSLAYGLVLLVPAFAGAALVGAGLAGVSVRGALAGGDAGAAGAREKLRDRASPKVVPPQAERSRGSVSRVPARGSQGRGGAISCPRV
jgi:hypothetical protein